MAASLWIALNDLRRRVRDRTALGLAFVAPFTMAAIVGLAFGSSNSAARWGNIRARRGEREGAGRAHSTADSP